MKLLVAPAEFYFKAGNYHVTYNLAKRINAKFYIISSRIDDSAKKELSNHQLYELNTSLLFYPFKVFMHGKKLVGKVDIIHHMSPFAIGKDFNLLALSTDKPFVIGPIEIPHKFFDDEFEFLRLPFFAKAFRESKIRHKLSIETLERCDVAVAVNRQTKKVLSNFVDRRKIQVIPIGVDANVFKYTSTPENYEILSVGVHIKRKGFEYLIKAMKDVVKEFSNARLNLTSSGPQTEYLKKLVEKLNLSKNIIFWGRVKDKELVKLYKMCRVFVHPSLSEGFCHTTLEAMAVGRSVISTKTNGSEMVEHKKTGLLVPPADSEALAEVILKILSDYDLAYRMGKRARKVVEKRYDWEIVAEKYYNIYLKLLS
ncbi:MAG: hypothetical protein PWP22_1157 [Thermoanaerobacter sp.]|nr:hypothetical protein [Thermoanaerobacter sp.]